MRTVQNNSSIIPPIVAFGSFEKASAEAISTSTATEMFDYTTQTTIIPLFMGSNKKCTKSAKNVGSFLFPKWKNETDDATEK